MESGSSANYENKFIVPEEGGSSKNTEEEGIPVKKLHLSVDPDVLAEEEGESSRNTGGGEVAARIEIDNDAVEENDVPAHPNYADKYVSEVTEEEVLASIHRRHDERDRRERYDRLAEQYAETRAVKMSIGNDEDMEGEDDETEEQMRMRLQHEMLMMIQRDRREVFDIEGHSDQLRNFIQNQVHDGVFPPDNAIGQGPLFTKKIPKIIEGYMWGATIGNGSYGKVKEVIDMFSLTRRAAKIMKYDKIKKIPNGWPNIRMEMKILNLLTHRNVIKLIEVFDIPDKKKVYMIFEYCIGSVQHLLDMEPTKRITIGESHMIFREMIDGLDYLHSKRISHKDIKPGNLLVAIDFSIKICDFGVAEEIPMYQNDGFCTRVNGTPKFQAPECVAGNHEFFDGYKVDIWSAGVTLFNMVSGKYPYEHPRLFNLYESIAKDPLVMPTNIFLSPDLIDLMERMMEKDFNLRIDTGSILLHPWFVTTFPEDESLGRVMERMRTGDRPLTMRPSMQVKYDGPTSLEDLECDKKEYVVPILTEGGEMDQDTFNGFKFIQPDSTLDSMDDLEPTRRPSSRSTPTAAPRITDTSTRPVQIPETRPRTRRSFFSCLSRNRSNS